MWRPAKAGAMLFKREAMEETGITERFLNMNILAEKYSTAECWKRQENHLFIVYKIYSDIVPVLNYTNPKAVEYFTEKESKKK